MSFDLSIIDKVDDEVGAGNRRSTKFAPRARARPTLKATANDVAHLNDDEKAANGPPRLDQPEHETDRNASRPLQEAQNNQPAQTAQDRERPLGDATPSTGQDEATLGPAQALPRAQQLENQHKGHDSDHQLADFESSKQPEYELPARLKRKLRSQSLKGPSREPGDENLAIVPFDGPEAGDQEKSPEASPKKKARGKSGKDCDRPVRMNIEQQANVTLDPEQDSIKRFVKRAMAQERVKQAYNKRKRAEDLEAGIEEEEEPLAIQAAPEQALTFAPQLELVDGKLVPKTQSLTIQAQAEPTHRRVREYNNIVNNASYTNRMPNDRWTPEETEAFFNAVRCFGANFELISKLFPGRPRKALANKWRRESRLNPQRIEEAYTGKGSLDGLEKIVEAMQQTETTAAGDVGELGIEATQFFEPELQEALPAIEAPPAPKNTKKSKKGAASRGATQPETSPEEEPQPKSTSAPKKTRARKPAPRGQKTKGRRGKAQAEEPESSPGGNEFDDIEAADEEGAEGLLQMAEGIVFPPAPDQPSDSPRKTKANPGSRAARKKPKKSDPAASDLPEEEQATKPQPRRSARNTNA